MTTKDVFIWDLLEQSPFLHSYLNEIEETNNNTDQTVGELLRFFRELEEIMDVLKFSVSPDKPGLQIYPDSYHLSGRELA